MTFAITKAQFTADDYRRIDSRFLPFINDWQISEEDKGKVVRIPGTWNSSISPFNYYEVIKMDGDPNSRESENEKELSLACGWKNNTGLFDREVQINLRIEGRDVLRTDPYLLTEYARVKAEIIKCGGASMKVYFNNKLITNFRSKSWWCASENGYQTISDMSVYL